MKNSNQLFIRTICYNLFILGFLFLFTACNNSPSKDKTSKTENKILKEEIVSSKLKFKSKTEIENNLISEKINGICHVVGNTVLDNLLEYKSKCEYTNKVLVTLHRRENHHWMSEWFTELNNIAKQNPDLEFILPIHPNPNVQKHRDLLTHVNVIEPLNHSELLKLLIKVKFVISDSGGLQEEGSFFNKK